VKLGVAEVKVGVEAVVDAISDVDTDVDEIGEVVEVCTTVVIRVLVLVDCPVAAGKLEVYVKVQFFSTAMLSLPPGSVVGAKINVQTSVVLPSGPGIICEVTMVWTSLALAESDKLFEDTASALRGECCWVSKDKRVEVLTGLAMAIVVKMQNIPVMKLSMRMSVR